VTNYTKSTDFAVKDALLSGNPSKLVKGTEINTEFANIQTADATSVKGSGSSVDNAIARFDGVTGYVVQNSAVSISDAGVVSGLASGLVATDATTLAQVQNSATQTLTSVSGTNTITGTLSPDLTAYTLGQTFRFVAVGANTGPVTINIDGLGAKSITKSGATALEADDILSGALVQISYDGTRFQLVSGAGGSAIEGAVNSLTQGDIVVDAGTGQVLVGPITFTSMTVNGRLVIL